MSVEDLYKLITDQERRLPVIVLTQPERSKIPVPILEFVLDPGKLSAFTFAFAHVVLLPKQESFEFTNRVGKPWSVYNGAVRTYMPHLDFANDALFRHPLTIIDRILFWNDPLTGDFAEKAFMSFLVNSIQSYGAGSRLDFKSIPFASELALEAAMAESRRIAESLSGSTTNKETIRKLEEQVDNLIKENEILKNSIAEKDQEVSEYCDMATEAERNFEIFKEENKNLRFRVTALAAGLEKKMQQKIDFQTPILDNLEDLPEWANEYLVARLVLHPRAIRALKDAEFEEVGLVYKALLLLANEYRDMRLSICTREQYEQARDALQLRESGSIDEGRAGEEGEAYYIQYPIGSGKRRFLESHLRRGNSRDPRWCLCIYYFWDNDSQQVIVGFLPGHLDNRLT